MPVRACTEHVRGRPWLLAKVFVRLARALFEEG